MSVTFGAGGSTLSHTPETVQRLRSEHDVAGVPHLTCVGGSREEIRSLLKLYRALGCNRIVALRGDTPSGMVRSGDLRYANELVELIRAEHGDHFAIEVAAYPETHPQAEDAMADLRNFKRKVDAGADSAITQYFYNTDAYFRFVDDARALGIDIPIVPGIMPISNFTPVAALLRSLRRGDPALDRPAHACLRRRCRQHPRVRGRLHRQVVRAAGRRRRTGPAFLHAQPVQAERGDPATPGLITSSIRPARVGCAGCIAPPCSCSC